MGSSSARRRGRGGLLTLAAGIVAVVLWWSSERGDAPSTGARVVSTGAVAERGGELPGPVAPDVLVAAPHTHRAPPVAAAPSPAESAVPDASAAPAPFLTIRDVDGTGAPQQGVGLDWVQRLALGTANFQSLDGATDAGGLLSLAEAPEWWAYMSASSTSPHAGALRAVGVRSSLPFDAYVPTDTDDAPGTVWLDREPEPGAIVEVVLPPTGGVRFDWGEIPGADGAPLTDFFLHVRRSDGDHFPRWRTGFKTRPDARGHLFAPVGLGWEVYGELSTHHVVGPLGRVRAPGPTVPGEVVTLRIEVDATHRDLVKLTGVAVADDGAPLGNPMWVRCELGPDGASTKSGRSVAFDAAGRWHVQVPRTRLASPLRLTHAAAQERRAAVPFDSAQIVGGVLDVGTVALRAVPPVVAPPAPVPTPLARGHVVDTEGAPLKGAHVSVWGRARSLNDAAIPPEDFALLASVYTKKDGSYELAAVAELAPGALRISAQHHEFLPTTVRECDHGATDVDFVLTRGARVSVLLRVEPILVLSEVIRPRLRGPNEHHGPASMGSRERSDASPDEFPVRFTGVPAGEYTLVIDMGQSHLPLVNLEVAVHGDTDVGTIDLRGRLGIVYLRLSNAAGEPVDTRHFGVRDAVTNENVAHEAVQLESGRVMLLAPLSLRDFTLDCGEAGKAHVPASLLRPIGEVEVPEFAPLTVR